MKFNLTTNIRDANIILQGVGGSLRPLGMVNISLSLAGNVVSHEFVVVENVNAIVGDLLFGWDLLSMYDLCIRPIDNGLFLDNQFFPLLPRRSALPSTTEAGVAEIHNATVVQTHCSDNEVHDYVPPPEVIPCMPVSKFSPSPCQDLATFFAANDDTCENIPNLTADTNDIAVASPLTWHSDEVSHASTAERVTIPGFSSLLIKTKIKLNGAPDLLNGHIFIEPSCTTHKCLALPPGLYQVKGGTAFIYVINVSKAPITLLRGTKVSLVEFTNNNLTVVDMPHAVTCASTQISTDNSETMENALQEILATNPNLSSDQISSLKDLFNKFPSILPSESRPIGRTELLQHSIKLVEGTTPRQIPAYRVPHSKRVQLEKEIQGMLKAGIISPSKSPWSSPILLIPKPDGNFRVVADFRYVNSKTVKESFPMADIKTLLMDINSNSKIFSSIDLKKGFLQVPLEEASKPITAFNTPSGCYEYNVVPMGLTNSLTFCRLMSLVLQGLLSDNVLIYMDDLLITSNTQKEHKDRLDQIFSRLHDANLTINPSKCRFFATSLVFIGHTLTGDGILPNKNKISAIEDFPTPRSAKDIKSFIGLGGFYRSFVPNFSSIAAPLTSLLKKDAKFKWEEDQENAFNHLKSLLVSSPVLAYPDYNKPFELYTDASNVGLGAVLMQKFHNKRRPIAYASRILSKTEKSYCTTDKEMAAIAWSLRHFRDIILGYKITVFTDHCPLTYMINSPTKDPFGKRARYFLTLSEYDLDVKYIKGSQNTPPDALSRAPLQIKNTTSDDMSDPFPPSFKTADPVVSLINSFPASVYTPTTTLPSLNTTDVRKELLKDDRYKSILAALESNQPPPKFTGLPVSTFVAHNGILFRQLNAKRLKGHYKKPVTQTVLPESYVDRFIERAHVETLHAGKQRTIDHLRKHFFFPYLARRTATWVDNCETCELYKGSVGNKNPCGTYDPPTRPWSVVFTDILTLPQSNNGHRYLIVFIDQGTRYCELAVIPDKTSKSIAKALFYNVICRWGTMETLVSDNAPEYTSDIIKELASLLNISHPPILPYRPEANGFSERLNRTIIQHIRTLSVENQEIWCEILPVIQGAINDNMHAAFADSPDFANFGRDKRLPYDLLLTDKPIPAYTFSTPSHLIRRQQLIWQATEKALKHAAEKAKQLQSGLPNPKGNLIGLKVYHLLERGGAIKQKLDKKFEGPFRVVDQIHNKAKCRHIATQQDTWFHVDKLKLASNNS